jgi:hypothetical protein
MTSFSPDETDSAGPGHETRCDLAAQPMNDRRRAITNAILIEDLT